jgi:hypothetical protein
VFIIIIIIIIIISFMPGIYTYIPETNYVPREYSVAAILLLLLMVLISLVSVFIIIIIIIIIITGSRQAQSLYSLRRATKHSHFTYSKIVPFPSQAHRPCGSSILVSKRMKMTVHLHLVTRFRMLGCLPHLPHTSWRSC